VCAPSRLTWVLLGTAPFAEGPRPGVSRGMEAGGWYLCAPTRARSPYPVNHLHCRARLGNCQSFEEVTGIVIVSPGKLPLGTSGTRPVFLSQNQVAGCWAVAIGGMGSYEPGTLQTAVPVHQCFPDRRWLGAQRPLGSSRRSPPSLHLAAGEGK